MSKAFATKPDDSPTLHDSRHAGSTRLTALLDRRVRPGYLMATLLALLFAQNLLLWRFLNFSPNWLYLLAGGCFVGIALFVTRPDPKMEWRGPTLRTLLLLGAASAFIFLLGGEGRVFYANADWQVRDAVLHDLRVQPWPFAYLTDGSASLLRAPIGMFLIPAIFGKAVGPAAADIALLIQNSLFLTIVFGLGSTLFGESRGRWKILLLLIAFSGMDFLGQLLRSSVTGEAIPDHLERWGFIQFSSHLTQAFWVPQHALAGWIGALLFLLWRAGRLSLGRFYIFMPMLMLLSPLGVMGTLPFAAYAGVATLLARQIRISDVVMPAAAVLLCVPAILYLGAAGDKVGIHLLSLPFDIYLLFQLVETLPFILGVALLNRSDGRELSLLLVVTLCLLVAPLFQLGEGMDFTMRVSIPALAILVVQVARALHPWLSSSTGGRPAHVLLAITLLIGSITGLFEIARALAYQPAPRIRCSLESVWNDTVGLPPGSSHATYIVPVDALPALLRPKGSFIVDPSADAACWIRPWMTERFGGR